MLHIEGLTVSYGPLRAVDDLDLHAEDGEVLSVLGPSGCGKSTLLRAIAGLVRPSTGRIVLEGRDITRLRPDRRDVGLMFQDHALFPHRSVGDNVAFGPRMQGLARHAITERVAEVLRLVDLDGTQQRAVTELSGGEQQRVALARALAPRPRLLMLDEPLGSLDRVLRDRLLDELPEVFRAAGITVLSVTHDQQEALAVADRVAVMRAGRFVRQDLPHRLWRDPGSEFVARFLGLEQLLDAEVAGGVATTVLGEIPVEDQPDGPARLVLLPDALHLDDNESAPGSRRAAVPALAGTVTARRFAGDHVRIEVDCDAGPRLGVPVWRGAGPDPGTRVVLRLDARAVRVVSPDLGTDGTDGAGPARP